MQVLAVLSQKGGAGKTTLTIHLGIQAHGQGKRVLFVDLDPQRSLSAWWQLRPTDTPQLVETDARRLPGVLEAARADGIELAVLDTAPAVSGDTATIARLADLALIPLRPGVLDLMAVAGTAETVRKTRTAALLVLNACPPARGTSEASVTMDARRALAGYAADIASVSVTDRRDFSRALNGGEAVNEFAPTSKAAVEIRRLWKSIERKLT